MRKRQASGVPAGAPKPGACPRAPLKAPRCFCRQRRPRSDCRTGHSLMTRPRRHARLPVAGQSKRAPRALGAAQPQQKPGRQPRTTSAGPLCRGQGGRGQVEGHGDDRAGRARRYLYLVGGPADQPQAVAVLDWPGRRGEGAMRAGRLPDRRAPGPGTAAGRASLTWQDTARAVTRMRSRPRPGPCRMTLAASSCAASITSMLRSCDRPAADAVVSTSSRSADSVAAQNSRSSTSVPAASLPGLDGGTSGASVVTGTAHHVQAACQRAACQPR